MEQFLRFASRQSTAHRFFLRITSLSRRTAPLQLRRLQRLGARLTQLLCNTVCCSLFYFCCDTRHITFDKRKNCYVRKTSARSVVTCADSVPHWDFCQQKSLRQEALFFNFSIGIFYFWSQMPLAIRKEASEHEQADTVFRLMSINNAVAFALDACRWVPRMTRAC